MAHENVVAMRIHKVSQALARNKDVLCQSAGNYECHVLRLSTSVNIDCYQ
jgi:hypothetical protein